MLHKVWCFPNTPLYQVFTSSKVEVKSHDTGVGDMNQDATGAVFGFYFGYAMLHAGYPAIVNKAKEPKETLKNLGNKLITSFS
jgi:hypothetical protein